MKTSLRLTAGQELTLETFNFVKYLQAGLGPISSHFTSQKYDDKLLLVYMEKAFSILTSKAKALIEE